VCPGLLRTGSPDHAEFKGQQQKEFAWFSIADSLPGFTLSAEQAGRQIWNACRRGEGRIVNISSLGGKVAMPHMAPYSASKFALVGLSEGFRAELRQYGISVTTVCPGLMRTGSPGHALVKGQQKKEFAWFSIADSLPGLTMDAEQAGRQIWNACRRGDGEIILSLPAKLLAAFHGLLPGTTTHILSRLNRALPATGESPAANVRRTGYESESALTRSPLTALTRKAAIKNNEV
jgi:NAD(P)-dependent dehydrogenase (short-subunit alcohol dehydrogenase family)